MQEHWAFDAADTSTWAAATADIDHVQAIGRHTEALLRAAATAEEAAHGSHRSGGGRGGGAARDPPASPAAELLGELQLR